MKLTKTLIQDIIDFFVFVAVFPIIIQEYNKLIKELNRWHKERNI